MPNVNNRSNKFQATREIYSTLEFVEEDNGRIADIALEAIQSSTMSKKRKKVLSTEVNFKRRRVADKITSMQRSMGPVAGTGDLENTTRRIRNEFEQNEDGSYDLSELMKSPPPSDHALVPAAVTPFSPVAEPTVGAQRKRNNSVMNTPELLPPSGGKEQYDPPSAIDAIKMHPKHLRARIVGSMVRNGKVPVQDRQVSRAYALAVSRISEIIVMAMLLLYDKGLTRQLFSNNTSISCYSLISKGYEKPKDYILYPTWRFQRGTLL